MDIKQIDVSVERHRPSWAGNPAKFGDLLMSKRPWKFEEDDYSNSKLEDYGL